MENKDIAAIFTEMADLMDIDGGDRYRIRAFRRIARVLENLREPVTSRMKYGELEKVPGIGEGAVHRIKQILRSGTCDDQVRLRAALPKGLRDLLRVKGIGVKSVRYLWERLRIGSIEELESAARAGRLQGMPGFGEGTAEKILLAIERARREVRRMRLDEALSRGGEIRDALVAEGASNCEITGSTRRRRETIEDLDFVVAADDPAPLIARFVVLPQVSDVLVRGETIASVLLGDGNQADMWVVKPPEFGAALHAYSGSQQHVVHMRARGNKLKLKMNEHGVWRREHRGAPVEGIVSTCPTEEELFDVVGLPYIAPELRENVGEIEAAERGKLPKIVTDAALKGDLHAHTGASHGGTGSVVEMARAAAALGYQYLAITDHWRDIALGFEARVKAIREADGKHGVRLLAGAEVSILSDGSIDADPGQLAQLDWVVGTVQTDFDQTSKQMTDRLLKAFDSRLIDCLGHPTGRWFGLRDASDLDVEKVMRAARRAGIALEINSHPLRMDMDSTFARYAKDLGVPVTVTADAHAPEELARRSFGIYIARRGWLEKRDLLNARRVEEVLRRRKERLAKGAVSAGALPDEPVTKGLTRNDRLADLEAELKKSPLAPELVERLDLYFREGDDELLEEALRKLGSSNPLQKAYELIVASNDPAVLREDPDREK